METFNFLSNQDGRRVINILDVPVDVVSLTQAVSTIVEWSMRKREDSTQLARRIVTANPEYIMASRRHPELMRAVQQAALVTPDGVGLIVAGKLLGTPLPGRVTGVELSLALAQCSAKTGLRLFLLGAGPNVAEEAASRLRQMFPGVCIVGTFAGEAGPAGDAETLQRVRDARPDVVLVAYGIGKQDYWAVRNLEQSGAAVSIGVGGTFDYLSGRVPLAPRLVRRAGMEWLFRLIIEPWRWRRDIAMLQFGSLALCLGALRVVRVRERKTGQAGEKAAIESLPGLLKIEQAKRSELIGNFNPNV